MATLTKDKLVDAAIASLREDGIDAISARTVAARAQVNQALIFYHFGTLAGLIDAAVRISVDESRARYTAAFAAVASVAELLDVGGRLHEEERDRGNVAMMAQLMAGAQHDPQLATASRYAMSAWVGDVETALRRLLADSVLGEVVDAHGLACAVNAGFIGLELYDGVDPANAAAGLGALRELVGLADAVDRLGPLARRGVLAALRSGR